MIRGDSRPTPKPEAAPAAPDDPRDLGGDSACWAHLFDADDAPEAPNHEACRESGAEVEAAPATGLTESGTLLEGASSASDR
jgi:hypothetical protein